MKNLHIKLFFYTLSLAMIGCAKVDDQAVSLAKVEVAKFMKDPESAKFTEVFTVDITPRDEGEFMFGVCGMVNGKNAFGAYAGAERFAAQMIIDKNKSIRLMYAEIDRKSDSRDGLLNFDKLYWNNSCVKKSDLKEQ